MALPRLCAHADEQLRPVYRAGQLSAYLVDHDLSESRCCRYGTFSGAVAVYRTKPLDHANGELRFPTTDLTALIRATQHAARADRVQLMERWAHDRETTGYQAVTSSSTFRKLLALLSGRGQSTEAVRTVFLHMYIILDRYTHAAHLTPRPASYKNPLDAEANNSCLPARPFPRWQLHLCVYFSANIFKPLDSDTVEVYASRSGGFKATNKMSKGKQRAVDAVDADT
ncbi:hypothetical protein A0H81_02868 [Grifola frondosa]|uniref:Uncharacterized protein n=1 Tax=Grifola frondosa TaxID=5627 RepID=A0A1C7MLM0_GRIFR|nr:hypothetical protein A0H81_02868 [Grifola frondosa]